MEVECLPTCRCSSWTPRQDSPGPCTVIVNSCIFSVHSSIIFLSCDWISFILIIKKKCGGNLFTPVISSRDVPAPRKAASGRPALPPAACMPGTLTEFFGS
ncbi:mCG1437, isoform CRA_a [Mus musculus]|nr:mCG1437, isoform CRA_a [Mus musculus]EDL33526.1 mCG1437, isoform CRA_a [Mus musculus]EDL33527.1 mCG1437, isoform CRA_a [Mus musculus]EDL33528.1 mCG1437, isoform CRA_a [Mus musculus]EDL33529.1 mCG1437, isoform CRA_a [Mus musculus]